MRIFIDGRDLISYPITQDEFGFSHKNLTYGGVLQRPLDFGSVKPAFEITSDYRFKVLSMKRYPAGSTSASYAKYQVLGTPYQIIMVHVEHLQDVGTVTNPGDRICSIGRSGHIGGYIKDGKFHSYYPHLHIAAQKDGGEFYVRQLLFAEKDPFYEILRVQRPDVIKAGVPVHLWWDKNGAKELRRKLKEAGRQDVLNIAGTDNQWLKAWYVKNGSKEYADVPFIWGYEKPDPCKGELEKQKAEYDRQLSKMSSRIAELQGKETQATGLIQSLINLFKK